MTNESGADGRCFNRRRKWECDQQRAGEVRRRREIYCSTSCDECLQESTDDEGCVYWRECAMQRCACWRSVALGGQSNMEWKVQESIGGDTLDQTLPATVRCFSPAQDVCTSRGRFAQEIDCFNCGKCARIRGNWHLVCRQSWFDARCSSWNSVDESNDSQTIRNN